MATNTSDVGNGYGRFSYSKEYYDTEYYWLNEIYFKIKLVGHHTSKSEMTQQFLK